MGKDTALAIQDIARVTLAPLHAIMIAVAFQPDGSAAGLAHGHAALIVAVGGTADSWKAKGTWAEHTGKSRQ